MKKIKTNPGMGSLSSCACKILIKMKLTLFLLLACTMSLLADDTYSQSKKLNLHLQGATIKEALTRIEDQSEFYFMYSGRVIDVEREVSVNIEDQKINNVLDQLFAGTDVNYTISDRIIVLTTPEIFRTGSRFSLQQHSVTGTVTDPEGNPLPGVNIVEVGTTNGAVTDLDGNYSITVSSEDAVLSFSFVGYLTEQIEVGGQTRIDLTLVEDIQELDEVVVIGYGVVKKSDLTGAVSQVKVSSINNTAVSRVDQALQGKAAGVQVTSTSASPGSGATIRIRGGNSIQASNEPLYVIDGFIGSGDLNTLNLNDVESIEILKDATATAIYGARGANGVILITTKRGEVGKTRIHLNHYYGIQQLRNTIDLLSGPERAAYHKEYQEFTGQPVTFPDPSNVQHTDWFDVMTQNAPITNTDIGVSGGNQSVNFYLSGNYFKQEGIVLGTGIERFQTRLNLDLKINDWLSTGTTMNLSRIHQKNNKVNWSDLFEKGNTTTPVYNEDGSYNEWHELGQNYFRNPLAEVDMVQKDTYKPRFRGNYYLNASFNNGLVFKSTFGADLNNSKYNEYQPGDLPRRKDQNLGGYAKVSSGMRNEILNENTVTYVKKFGEHSVNLLGGFTYQHFKGESVWASADGFINDLFAYNNLSAGAPELRQMDSNYTDWTILSYIGRTNYIFKDRYLLTLVGRYDGSSRLAANHKWAFFPSAAIAWRLIEEDFIKNIGLFSNLKFRASYGKTGNQAIDIYSTLPSLNTSKMYFNNMEVNAYNTGNIANPDLTWETTDQFDIGLEAGFFNNKLSFEMDYYYKRTNDLLLSIAIPRQTGYSKRLVNLGEIENQGLELLINAHPIKTTNFSWDITFNISGNRNRVINIGQTEDTDFIEVGTAGRLIVGEPAIVFYGYIYDGVWHTQEEIDKSNGLMENVAPGYPKYKDIDGNGIWDREDRKIIGSPQPDFFGGIQNSLKYKNLSFDFYLAGTYGNEIYNTFATDMFFGDFASNIHAKAIDRWTPENSTSDWPFAGNWDVSPHDPSTVNVQDGSYLKLKMLRLSYDFNASKLNWLNRAMIYLQGENIFCLTNYYWGFDPEINAYGTHSILRGYDGFTYPSSNRTFTVGLNLEF